MTRWQFLFAIAFGLVVASPARALDCEAMDQVQPPPNGCKRVVERVLIPGTQIAKSMCRVLCPSQLTKSAPPVWRQIIDCNMAGAITGWLMEKCMGREVSTDDFEACVSGDACLGGEPRPALEFKQVLAKAKAAGRPCPPMPKRGTITGGGFSHLGLLQRLEQPPTIACHDGLLVEQFHYYEETDEWQGPVVEFADPDQQLRFAVDYAGSGGGTLRLAIPPLPSLPALDQCKREALDDSAFRSCMVEKALPREYKLTRACLNRHPGDTVSAYFCSTGNPAGLQSVRDIRKVSNCLASAKSAADLTTCIPENAMGGRERRWVKCIAANQTDTTGALLCGLNQDLTPEQQIAVACAAKTGGEPKTFAVCTGGQLMARELDKCWSGGIATEQGCFGPNNEIFKYWNSLDRALLQALGPTNDLYRTFVFFKNNLFVPSASHDFVRAANTVLNDVRNGPGPNNEVVKAVNAIANGVQSVGRVFRW